MEALCARVCIKAGITPAVYAPPPPAAPSRSSWSALCLRLSRVYTVFLSVGCSEHLKPRHVRTPAATRHMRMRPRWCGLLSSCVCVQHGTIFERLERSQYLYYIPSNVQGHSAVSREQTLVFTERRLLMYLVSEHIGLCVWEQVCT